MPATGNSETRKVRPPAVAGRFYPQDPALLAREVNVFLQNAPRATGPVPKAIIAPHAGYLYSGPIAGSAYAQLLPAREQITRVVLLGPAHFVAVRGLATSTAMAFATPLGEVPVDVHSVRQLLALSQVCGSDEAHAMEHSLEVQLPFLQVVLRKFALVPLVAGDATADEVSQVLEMLWGGPETCFVISSDLSHYHDSDTARQQDGATARAIENLRADTIGEQDACGKTPICGLLKSAQSRKLQAHVLDLRNSSDTAGPRDRVVGYGAFAFQPAVTSAPRS